MTDHIDPDKVREVMEDMAYSLEQNGGPGHDFATARWMSRLEALLPTPKPKTLDDLIEEGHDPTEYQWMQAGHRGERCIIIRTNRQDPHIDVSLLTATGSTIWTSPDEVIPRPDKPRLVWPTSEQEPAEETPTPEAAPKVLTTRQDYENAPYGTVIAKGKEFPFFTDTWAWHYSDGRTYDHSAVAGTPRSVLRWGMGEQA